MKPPDFLRFYGRAFDTVEVDSTYYATPPEHVVRGWAEKVPTGFRFSLKLPRALTPEAGPPDPARLEMFCERARSLGEQLGPVLVQLGLDFAPDGWPVVESFLARLPAGLRWAIEFRRHGWVGPRLLERLREHGVALALVAGRWARHEEMIDLAIHPTADFAYLRWMGTGRKLEDFSRVRLSRDRELSAWAVALAALAARVPAVYGYFSNHFQGHAPASAREMQRLIGLAPVQPDRLRSQASLF